MKDKNMKKVRKIDCFEDAVQKEKFGKVKNKK